MLEHLGISLENNSNEVNPRIKHSQEYRVEIKI